MFKFVKGAFETNLKFTKLYMSDTYLPFYFLSLLVLICLTSQETAKLDDLHELKWKNKEETSSVGPDKHFDKIKLS